MKRWFIILGALSGLLLAAFGCGGDPTPAAPTLAEPAFLYFFTDN